MNIIGIYPGSFQPPTDGNYRAYKYLKQYTGVNTFVTTNDVINLPNSPLSFQDKQTIWTRHGVPIDKVVMTTDPHKALEVTQKFGPDRTVVIFGMTTKDTVIALRGGGYFLPFRGISQATQPLNKHAYILMIPDEIGAINKKLNKMTIRQAFGSKKLSEEQKKSFFKQIFGWYDISLFDLIKKKFAEANTVKERFSENTMPIIRRTLKTFVREVLGQLSTPQGQGTQPSAVSNTGHLSTEPALTPTQIQKQTQDARKQRDAQLKAKTMELDVAKKLRNAKKAEIDQINRNTVPNTTKDIQRLKGAKI